MATENTAAPAASARHERQEVTGVVTSAKMEKTIIVKVTRMVQHKLYRRVIRVSKKFYRPLSKLKRWRLAEVVTRSTRAV
jgi:small subunit ribosomal protein S17